MEQWIRNRVVTPRNWTDAYLAAFAVSASLRLVSFDADFKKFPGLDFLHLSD
jgi:predicted nucleic acid-binding protein